MTTTHRWRTRPTTAGAGLLLLLLGGACSDNITAPTSSPTRHSGPAIGNAVGAAEQIYLIDNKCLMNSQAYQCQHANGSVIYTVVLSGTTGTNTFWKSLTGHCADDTSIDCDVWYDQAHIGATPDGSRVYAVNRRSIGLNGNPVGYVDVATKVFHHVGLIKSIGRPDGVVLAAFSRAGDLYIGNQDDNRIYKINLTTLNADQSWSIARPGGVGMLDLDGADFAFDASDVLYLYTNASKFPGDRGLYTVDLSTNPATSTKISGPPVNYFFTGMAILNGGAGDIVMSNAIDDKFYELSPSGVVVTTYQMAGDLTNHLFGDMTSGPLPATFSIGDRVWNDLDGNGVQNTGEPGLTGWTVTLTHTDGTPVTGQPAQTTGTDGAYSFTGLPAGDYKVCVTPASGWVQTFDLDGLATPDCATVTVGPSHTDVDFGYRQNACPAGLISSLTGTGVTDKLFIFTDGSTDANWQGASKGFVGDVMVANVADKRTSGTVPYAGTISTDGATLGAWSTIVTDNAGQAFSSLNQTAQFTQLSTNLTNAFLTINALPATTGYTSVSSTSLDGLNTQDGIPKTYVINVTSDFSINTQIDITGDAGDLFILRWDTDADFTNGYQGQVQFQSGGAIVPHGGLTPANFISVAGNIGASGGGSNPAAPYPQGPRLSNGTGALITGGADFNGGGFFTGYWLTTGTPTTQLGNGLWVGATSSLSNAIFVGGWYSLTTQFSMTSGTSGVHIVCP